MSANFRRLILCLTLCSVAAQAQIIIQPGNRIQILGGRVIQGRSLTSTRTASPETDIRHPTLVWKNGETMEGSVAGADKDTLLWRAESHEPAWRGDIFAEPLKLRLSALRRIDFPKAFLPPPAEPFAIALGSGDRIFADIVGVSEAGLVTSSRRHGPLTVAMSAIVSITRLKDEQVLYSGPTALNGWRQIDADRSNLEPKFAISPEGGFIIKGWNRSAFLPVELPDKGEMRLQLSSIDRPSFAIGFARTMANSLMVETWDDELVIADQNTFIPVRTIAGSERTVDLRILWDRAAKTLAVYDWAGKKLAEMPQSFAPSSVPGVLIRNKRAELTLRHLSVRKWDGSPPLALATEGSLVELSDGRLIPGELAAGADGSDFNVQGADGVFTPIKLAQLRSYRKANKTPPPGEVSRIEYEDGTLISGKIVSVTGEVASMQSGLSPQPLTARLEGATRLKIAEPEAAGTVQEPPLEQQARLTVGTHSIAGHIEGTGGNILLWRATGSVSPSTLNADRGQFDINSPPVALKPEQASTAVFILKGGQLLPGTLLGVDEKGVKLKSPFAAVTELSAEHLQAVYFRDPNLLKPRGLDDSNWRVVKGEPKNATVANGTLTLRDRAMYGHPSILAGDELQFSFHTPDSTGAMAVQLFKDAVDSPQRAGTLHLMRSGNQFWCAVERADGQSRSSDYVGNIKPGPVKLSLLIRDGMMEVRANGMPLVNAALPDADRKGQALTFGASEMWGGGQATTLQVSQFTVISRPDHLPRPMVDEKSKDAALTVPRFRREAPPRHALLAPNGDLLRGRLEAVEKEGLKFTAGLETVIVPLQRIQAAVWLQPADAPATPEEASVGSYHLVLQDGGRFMLNVDRFDATSLHGVSPMLGECTIPYEVISVLRNAALPESAALAAYSGWQLKNAPEPVLPEDGGQSSPLLGKPAPAFTIQRLGSVPFDLASERGKVVVLDFWATWCGPCIAALPETLKVMSGFDRNQVHFLALNQGENEGVVKTFLEKRGWVMDVALDLQQKVGADYGVEGIPHTVIIGKDGNVAWTHTGNAPGDAAKLAAAIQKALAGP